MVATSLGHQGNDNFLSLEILLCQVRSVAHEVISGPRFGSRLFTRWRGFPGPCLTRICPFLLELISIWILLLVQHLVVNLEVNRPIRCSYCQRKILDILTPQFGLCPWLQTDHEVEQFVLLEHLTDIKHQGAKFFHSCTVPVCLSFRRTSLMIHDVLVGKNCHFSSSLCKVQIQPKREIN